MNCSYTLTKPDVVKAMQIHSRGSYSTLIISSIVGIALVLLGAVSKYKAIAFGGAVGGFAGYIVMLFVVVPFNAKRQFEQNRALRSEISMHLSQKGISFEAETGESNLQWSDIHKWKLGKGIYLLYITSNMFHIVPSRALADENELASYLNDKVGSKKP